MEAAGSKPSNRVGDTSITGDMLSATDNVTIQHIRERERSEHFGLHFGSQ